MNNSQQLINYRKSLRQYMEQLSKLSNITASESALTSLDEVARLRVSAKELALFPKSKFQLPFECKTEPRFSLFLKHLMVLNPEPIYIWTEAANGCGLFQVKSLEKLKLDFSYNSVSQGIFVILTHDIKDRMTWDFFEEAGSRILEIELNGHAWPKAIY